MHLALFAGVLPNLAPVSQDLRSLVPKLCFSIYFLLCFLHPSGLVGPQTLHVYQGVVLSIGTGQSSLISLFCLSLSVASVVASVSQSIGYTWR